MKLRNRKRVTSGTGWEAVVTGAVAESYYYDTNRRGDPIDGTVAVRLYRDGRPRMTFATLRVADPNFEDAVTTARAEAMERASVLNAVEAA